jgi:hypothetical protein
MNFMYKLPQSNESILMNLVLVLFASKPLADIQFMPSHFQFKVLWLAVLCYANSNPFHYLLWEYCFWFMPFWFLPTFSGKRLGCKTRAWCTVFQNVLLPMYKWCKIKILCMVNSARIRIKSVMKLWKVVSLKV